MNSQRKDEQYIGNSSWLSGEDFSLSGKIIWMSVCYLVIVAMILLTISRISPYLFEYFNFYLINFFYAMIFICVNYLTKTMLVFRKNIPNERVARIFIVVNVIITILSMVYGAGLLFFALGSLQIPLIALTIAGVVKPMLSLLKLYGTYHSAKGAE